MADKKMGYKEMPVGDILAAGTAANFKTGDWRSKRPVFNKSNCRQCFICWTLCPDAAIKVENDEVVGIDYDHCKGCGICDHECPTKPESRALQMEPERK